MNDYNSLSSSQAEAFERYRERMKEQLKKSIVGVQIVEIEMSKKEWKRIRKESKKKRTWLRKRKEK